MASLQLAMNSNVLPPVLANAALLIAAPSLGCLNRYTRAITDLCRAYGLPVPDLAKVLEHRVTTPPSLATTTEFDGCTKETMGTSDIMESKPELTVIKIEKEFSSNENDYEIPAYDRCSNEVQNCISLKEEMDKGTNETLRTSHKIQELTQVQFALNKTKSTISEKVQALKAKNPKNVPLGMGTLPAKNGNGYYLYDKSVRDILHNYRKSQTTPALQEGNMVLGCFMSVKFSQNEYEEPVNCGMYYTTNDRGSTPSPCLHILTKNEGWTHVSFTKVSVVSIWNRESIIIHYFSVQNDEFKTIYIHPHATKLSNGNIRSKRDATLEIIHQLHTFIG